MTSQVTIVNQALLMLGENTIQSLDENTTEAQTAAAFYADTRSYVLTDLKPSFARTRLDLADPLQPPGVGGYAYRYALPVNALVVLSAGSDTREFTEWLVEGRELLSVQPLEWLVYVYTAAGLEAFMDAMFVKALVAYLASELAYPIMASKERANELLDMYGLRASEARNLYGQQASVQITKNDELSVSR
jgi:hypothetical protein